MASHIVLTPLNNPNKYNHLATIRGGEGKRLKQPYKPHSQAT